MHTTDREKLFYLPLFSICLISIVINGKLVPLIVISDKGACLFRTSRNQVFQIIHISFGSPVTFFISSNFIPLSSERNAFWLKFFHFLTFRIFGSFFILDMRMLLITDAAWNHSTFRDRCRSVSCHMVNECFLSTCCSYWGSINCLKLYAL